MELIAHRGFAAERAENTILALERAAEIADVIEFDVRRCGSGEPVVVHDATVDRVTDATGPVAEFTADELATMDVLGSGAGIPTLAAVLDALPDDATLFVELKETGITDAVLATLAGREGRTVCSSFQPAALREVRAADPGMPTAYIAGRLRDAPVTTATELDAGQIHVRARLAAHPRIRQTARRLGMGVYAWTARSRASAQVLSWLGVDGITSDRSDVLPADR